MLRKSPPGNAQSTPEAVYSVSSLMAEVRQLLEGVYPLLWVEGEITGMNRPGSGHLYFSLKDGRAQVRCALFRNRSLYLRAPPRDGDQVLARARISLYEPRGDFQLIIEHLEPAGEGRLRREFELLKQRLAAEGLFDAAHKKPLPGYPRRIGILTSPSGAAVRDILSVLSRRFPSIPVILYPIPVQGATAPADMVDMLACAIRRHEVDVLILARGGGSIEDLACFNDETLARALHACPIPLITGIGHEIDFTLADFVADVRAPTPTAAAELVTPDAAHLRQVLEQQQSRMQQRMERLLSQHQRHFEHLAHRLRLQHPETRTQQQWQRLDQVTQRLLRLSDQQGQKRQQTLAQLQHRLLPRLILGRIPPATRWIGNLEQRAQQALNHRLEHSRSRLQALTGRLEAVSPLGTLSRGYSLVRTQGGDLVHDIREVQPASRLQIRLRNGQFDCQVLEVNPD